MTLIKSISGIRGTIGGKVGDSLTPYDVVKFTAAYATWLQGQHPPKTKCKIVLGRDARISGPMIHQLVCGTLTAKGMDVIDVGLSTTPTVEMAVTFHKAHGGIILTASHNPKQWNALKLLNGKGEFISAADGEQLLKIAENDNMEFAQINQIGTVTKDDTAIQKHIEAILALPLVNRKAISEKNLKLLLIVLTLQVELHFRLC